jgi:glycosyltransferase involved in cell wall biosynthesis
LSVAILLCAYNGERFLSEQLDSIEHQTHREWTVWVSDDGSSDGTQALLQRYRERWGTQRLQVVAGPRAGFARNFLSLTCRKEIAADHYAYCDQDDIWEADKLARAVAWLDAAPAGRPALYCSRTRLIDEAGAEIGLSPLFTKPPDVRNALVQNVGGGNTMVFNQVARQMLLAAGADLDVVAHDWWTYIAVASADGAIRYDPHPSLLYRQHGENLIGANKSRLARLLRMRQLLDGRLRGWIDANIRALHRIEALLPERNRRLFHDFVAARDAGFTRRVAGMARIGIYRQSFVDNIGLIAAVVLKKL